uniref:Uncharacterized protein n=1 Tax=Anguilla anguilla TaxID=7936 RepID=A0A0E9UF14_ANGAN
MQKKRQPLVSFNLLVFLLLIYFFSYLGQ